MRSGESGIPGKRISRASVANVLPNNAACSLLRRRRKLILVALVGYLALPFDLVPDFIPVARQLDDAVIVALVLRYFIQSGGEPLIRELWPGPEQSLALILRLARPRSLR